MHVTENRMQLMRDVDLLPGYAVSTLSLEGNELMQLQNSHARRNVLIHSLRVCCVWQDSTFSHKHTARDSAIENYRCAFPFRSICRWWIERRKCLKFSARRIIHSANFPTTAFSGPQSMQSPSRRQPTRSFRSQVVRELPSKKLPTRVH